MVLKNVRVTYWKGDKLVDSFGEMKTSTGIIIPKDHPQIGAIKAEIEKLAKEAGFKGTYKSPLRDGDTEKADQSEYAGCYWINASSKRVPTKYDMGKNKIDAEGFIYSGCYVNIIVNFFSFNGKANKGVAVGLGDVQKFKDGENLGAGGERGEDVFEASEDNLLD